MQAIKRKGLHHISEDDKRKATLERTPEERLYLLTRLIILQKKFLNKRLLYIKHLNMFDFDNDDIIQLFKALYKHNVQYILVVDLQ